MYLKDIGVHIVVPPDLKQTFENKFNMNIGKNEIIKMRNNNVITDRDVEIAKFLFRFKFATADQIYRLLKEDKSKVNLKNRLDKLVKYRILNKFMLGDIESDRVELDAYQTYCLDLGGRYLLASYAGELDVNDWYSVVNMKTSAIISKMLLATEIYIRVMETCPEKLIDFKIEPEYRVAKKTVIPTFEMSMNINGQIKYYIGECVRDFDFPTYYRDKAFKLESFMTTNAWKKYFFDSEQPPILFIFADDDQTAHQAALATTEMTEIKDFRLSTDERLQKVLFASGTFLKFLPEEKMLQAVKASTFKPNVQPSN